MNKVIVELYSQMRGNNIHNRIDSLYWIYRMENIIVKEQGVSKRYLKVFFFNRKMNEQNYLMRMYLKVDSIVKEINQFSVVSSYHDPSIMGMAVEIDLLQEHVEVEIQGYIANGKKYETSGRFIEEFCTPDPKKFALLKECGVVKEGQEDTNVYPIIEEDHWICLCGFYNNEKDIVCPICARKKEDIKQLLSQDIRSTYLNKITDTMKISTAQSVEALAEAYAKQVEQAYGIPRKEVKGALDMEVLKQRQTSLIHKEIEEQMDAHPYIPNTNDDFETEIDAYCERMCKGIITKEMVMSHMDMEACKLYYDQRKEEKKQKRKASTRRNRIIIGVFIILLVSILGGYAYNKMNEKNHYQGIELSIDEAQREEECKTFIEKHPDLATAKEREYIQKHKLCPIENVSIDPGKLEIKKDGDKEIRPLNEKYVLVTERKDIGENRKKRIQYVADLDKNVVYDNSEKNYYLETYQDDRIIKKEMVVDDAVEETWTYDYTDDDNYTYTISNKSGTSTYVIENEKLTYMTYTYTSDNEEHFNQYKYDDNGELISRMDSYGILSYEDNLPMQYTGSYQDGKYLYDTNRLFRQYHSTQFIQTYMYDFDKMKIYLGDYDVEESGNPILSQLYEDNFRFMQDDPVIGAGFYPYISITPITTIYSKD